MRSLRSWFKRRPLLMYGLLTLGTVLWVYGLTEQLYSAAAIMKYLVMSLILVAVAVI